MCDNCYCGVVSVLIAIQGLLKIPPWCCEKLEWLHNCSGIVLNEKPGKKMGCILQSCVSGVKLALFYYVILIVF